MKNNLQQAFIKQYNREATQVYFSPGRVNLIGEHIDYNGGLVMPCAITFGTYLLIAPNNENVFRFKSLNFEEEAEISFHSDLIRQGTVWYNYPLGVISYFKAHEKQLRGIDMLYYGDIPIGSGLSSSASIEVVTAFALNDLLNAGFSKLDLVKLSQWVENNFIGLNSGIMDQFAVAFGKKSKALMLNCNTLDYTTITTNLGKYVLAIINTNKPRRLAESKYNERVKECGEALKALQQELPVNYLCDTDTTTFNKYEHLIKDEIVKNRARHVVEENDRVKMAAIALGNNNLAEFGQLMYASHQSLSHLYEVSGIELDTVVEYCKTDHTIPGARMTGAGFGGCAIALIKEDQFDSFSRKMTDYYTEKIGYAPSVYKSLIGDGVKELSSE